jgi:hypothetical protein
VVLEIAEAERKVQHGQDPPPRCEGLLGAPPWFQAAACPAQLPSSSEPTFSAQHQQVDANALALGKGQLRPVAVHKACRQYSGQGTRGGRQTLESYQGMKYT